MEVLYASQENVTPSNELKNVWRYQRTNKNKNRGEPTNTSPRRLEYIDRCSNRR